MIKNFVVYLLVMAGVTYLVRMLPLCLVKKKITNKFILSFLYYIPYAVLAVMTVPACFFATDSIVAAIFGFLVAVLLALKNKSLLVVAIGASSGVLLAEIVIKYIL